MKFKEISFSELKGKILKEIKINEEKTEILFVDSDDKKYLMWHSQSCCERVSIEDICGDFDDLLNSQILISEESSVGDSDIKYGIERWTFYKISTINGSVTIRWYGE